jgi:hypothetical protein
MSLWKKIKRGFKKAVNWSKGALSTVGRGLKKGTEFVKKTIGRASKLPVIGDLLRKVGKTRILGLPSLSDIGSSALNVADDIGGLATKLEGQIGDAQRGNTAGLRDSLKKGVQFARSRMKK